MSQNSFGDNLKNLIAEQNRRNGEALRLYRPMDTQLPFHTSKSYVRVVRGGTRSGKSTSAAIEFASAATGIPLTDSHGNTVPFQYPTNRPLIMWVIGWDEKHIGKTIYRLLRQPGVFKIIRDKATGQMRAFRPWDPEDVAREKECEQSPPLIPDRFLDGEPGWNRKRENVFHIIKLINGTEIRSFPSSGKPPQGDPADVIWVDEDIQDASFIPELVSRLPDRQGRMFWSAFPHSKNMALMQLSDRAELDRESPEPVVSEIVLFQSGNLHLNQKSVQDGLSLMDEDQRRARDRGEFLTDNVSVFPRFDARIHCTPCKNPNDNDAIDKALAENNLTPPDDWTLWAAVDPGHTRPGLIFGAVPPPELEPAGQKDPTLVIFDEVFAPKTDATYMAEEFKRRWSGRYFEGFVIDWHCGRQTAAGRGDTTEEHYSKEFEKQKLRCRLTGSRFINGSDDILGGITMIRHRLDHGKGNRGTLRIITEKCPNLCRQMDLYKKTMAANGVINDKPANYQIDDLVDCLRYLVAAKPYYRKPEKISHDDLSPAYREWLRIQKEKNRGKTGAIYLGVVGGAA